MRIGTNHGSLSDRIMNRFGDTPSGMVESALEFARICRALDYHDFIFSMKASNPQVMIQAYRLLTAAMIELGWNYPLHLGVTEAGEGEDGRVKSAMGIGTLLLDGIGDTIRVSLTEDPWKEIDPCQRLVRLAKSKEQEGILPFIENTRSIDQIQRRSVYFPLDLALHRNGSVFVTTSAEEMDNLQFFEKLGCEGPFQRPKLKSMTADAIILHEKCKKDISALRQIQEIGVGVLTTAMHSFFPQVLFLSEALQNQEWKEKTARFAANPFPTHAMPLIVQIDNESVEEWQALKQVQPSLIFLSPDKNRLHYCRQFFDWLQKENLQIPVILHFTYDCSQEDMVLLASMECGALLCDGLGEGLWLEGPYSLSFIRELSFSILQAARMRMSKTDFISCPSCGRTLFDLQEVTKKIQSRTSHLPGVKIAIMGCVVNGPGEMADADFGYVGSKPGKIDLYVGKECVEKDINSAEAVDRLVDLLKRYDRWIEPAVEETPMF
jgi:(E)-4-hydroxy-3-methylbut-2-enyl-diphosphate synthase